MPDYEKPNMILPVSLHDARLNHIEIADDTICFEEFARFRMIKWNKPGKLKSFFQK